jgi:hypothetical protein
MGAVADLSRNYLTQDIVRRILRDYFGYDVNFVMNVTDIDDKASAVFASAPLALTRLDHLARQRSSSFIPNNISFVDYHHRIDFYCPARIRRLLLAPGPQVPPFARDPC